MIKRQVTDVRTKLSRYRKICSQKRRQCVGEEKEGEEEKEGAEEKEEEERKDEKKIGVN